MLLTIVISLVVLVIGIAILLTLRRRAKLRYVRSKVKGVKSVYVKPETVVTRQLAEYPLINRFHENQKNFSVRQVEPMLLDLAQYRRASNVAERIKFNYEGWATQFTHWIMRTEPQLTAVLIGMLRKPREYNFDRAVISIIAMTLAKLLHFRPEIKEELEEAGAVPALLRVARGSEIPRDTRDHLIRVLAEFGESTIKEMVTLIETDRDNLFFQEVFVRITLMLEDSAREDPQLARAVAHYRLQAIVAELREVTPDKVSTDEISLEFLDPETGQLPLRNLPKFLESLESIIQEQELQQAAHLLFEQELEDVPSLIGGLLHLLRNPLVEDQYDCRHPNAYWVVAYVLSQVAEKGYRTELIEAGTVPALLDVVDRPQVNGPVCGRIAAALTAIGGSVLPELVEQARSSGKVSMRLRQVLLSIAEAWKEEEVARNERWNALLEHLLASILQGLDPKTSLASRIEELREELRGTRRSILGMKLARLLIGVREDTAEQFGLLRTQIVGVEASQVPEVVERLTALSEHLEELQPVSDCMTCINSYRELGREMAILPDQCFQDLLKAWPVAVKALPELGQDLDQIQWMEIEAPEHEEIRQDLVQELGMVYADWTAIDDIMRERQGEIQDTSVEEAIEGALTVYREEGYLEFEVREYEDLVIPGNPLLLQRILANVMRETELRLDPAPLSHGDEAEIWVETGELETVINIARSGSLPSHMVHISSVGGEKPYLQIQRLGGETPGRLLLWSAKKFCEIFGYDLDVYNEMSEDPESEGRSVISIHIPMIAASQPVGDGAG